MLPTNSESSTTIVLSFKMYHCTNSATWVHLGSFVWDIGWLHDKCRDVHVAHSFWKLSFWNFAQVPLIFFNEIVPIILSECLFYLVHFKDDTTIKRKNMFFFNVLSKPDLLCYILLHSIHIYTNFRVFYFKWYQEYAYPCFRICISLLPELQAVRFGYVILGGNWKRGGILKRF